MTPLVELGDVDYTALHAPGRGGPELVAQLDESQQLSEFVPYVDRLEEPLALKCLQRGPERYDELDPTPVRRNTFLPLRSPAVRLDSSWPGWLTPFSMHQAVEASSLLPN